MNLPEKIYTEADLQKAKSSGKRVGWVQGAGIVVGGAVLWNLLGWIPIVIGLAAVGWVLYRLLGGSDESQEE